MTGGAGHGDQCSAGGPDDNRAGDVEDSAEGGDVVRPLLPRPGGRRAGIRAAGAALIQVDDLGQLRECGELRFEQAVVGAGAAVQQQHRGVLDYRVAVRSQCGAVHIEIQGDIAHADPHPVIIGVHRDIRPSPLDRHRR